VDAVRPLDDLVDAVDLGTVAEFGGHVGHAAWTYRPTA